MIISFRSSERCTSPRVQILSMVTWIFSNTCFTFLQSQPGYSTIFSPGRSCPKLHHAKSRNCSLRIGEEIHIIPLAFFIRWRRWHPAGKLPLVTSGYYTVNNAINRRIINCKFFKQSFHPGVLGVAQINAMLLIYSGTANTWNLFGCKQAPKMSNYQLKQSL